MEAEELLIVLKRIQSCLNHNDWINAKEYLIYEIAKLERGDKYINM